MRSRGIAVLVAVALVATSACHALEPPPSADDGGGGATLIPSPSIPPGSTPTSTPDAGDDATATLEPAPSPTARPTATPGAILDAANKITYTSRASVGGILKLTVTIKNTGKKKAGKITMEIVGISRRLAGNTPLRGCVPDCRGTKDADRVAFAVWTGPPAGAKRVYQAQLKARKAGTFTFMVRVYAGTAGEETQDLGSWTVTTVVK